MSIEKVLGKRGVVLALAVAATVLVAAGCGSGSKNSTASTTTTSAAPAPAVPQQSSSPQKLAYERQMQTLGRSLGAVLAKIGAQDQVFITDAGAAGQSTVLIGITKNLQKGQKQLRVAAVKLAAMHPPADVKADHAALTQAVREYASELSMVISEVKSGSTGDLGSIASLKGVLAMEKASQAITAKGYAIL